MTPDYAACEFSGEVNWVDIEIPADARDHDGEVTSEERLKAALIREYGK